MNKEEKQKHEKKIEKIIKELRELKVPFVLIVDEHGLDISQHFVVNYGQIEWARLVIRKFLLEKSNPTVTGKNEKGISILREDGIYYG